mgnify:CR=1 FL=1
MGGSISVQANVKLEKMKLIIVAEAANAMAMRPPDCTKKLIGVMGDILGLTLLLARPVGETR